MARYIDADALGIGKADRKIFNVPEYADGWNSAVDIIEEAPTADVAEVKHGEWKGKPIAGYSDIKCSVCNKVFPHQTGKWNYCPNCGAMMDKEKE